jgi:hypothetical protein
MFNAIIVEWDLVTGKWSAIQRDAIFSGTAADGDQITAAALLPCW